MDSFADRPSMTDTAQLPWLALLARAQGGDETSVAVIYRRHQPSVLRYLRVCDLTAAEDIASVVWMDAARSLGGFDGDESAFVGWLFTIVRRRLIDHQRRVAREPWLSVATPMKAADETVLSRQNAADAATVVRKTLSPIQAEVVLLRSVAGLSVPEVANVVDKSETAVRILQHRGLRKLAQVFTPESFSEEVKQNAGS